MIAPAGWRGVIAETLGCPDPGVFLFGPDGFGLTRTEWRGGRCER